MFKVNITEVMNDAEPQAIKPVSEAADKYFVGNAQLLRRQLSVETSLFANWKDRDSVQY